ncbi:Predicted PurR-regulated permease PerM [Lachnospiraceae bacterium C10]|nr:Predicted PurR-regulated permease PerM [Lachnospiraceae bacterium C10]
MSEERKTRKHPMDYLPKEEVARYHVIAISAVLSAMLIIIFYFCVERYEGLKVALDDINKVLQPVLMGFAMAYLMNPIMKFIESKVYGIGDYIEKKTGYAFGEKVKKAVRTIASILAVAILIAVVVAFLSMVIPQFVKTINELVRNIHAKVGGVLDWVDEITGYRFKDELVAARKSQNIDKAIDKGIEMGRRYLNVENNNQLVSFLTALGVNVGHFFVNLVIGIFVAVYTLGSKEKLKAVFKKSIYALFPQKAANEVVITVRKANEIFYGFIIGKIIDSIIIGILCYFAMLLFGFPYALVCSAIIGVTNVIPVFGPYIGAVPTVALIFVTNPMQGIYYLLFVLVLQQIDGNVIGPKILGDSTGISPFLVLVAIVVGGGMFGVIGMLLGVPTMALMVYIVGRIFNHLIKGRGLPTGTMRYENLDYVDLGGNTIVEKKDKQKVSQTKSLVAKICSRLFSFGKKEQSDASKPDTKDTTKQ